jgi:hypothetical protein
MFLENSVLKGQLPDPVDSFRSVTGITTRLHSQPTYPGRSLNCGLLGRKAVQEIREQYSARMKHVNSENRIILPRRVRL